MRHILIAILGLAVPLVAAPPDTAEGLTADLNKPWHTLTVSAMVNQGCVAPIYFGIQLHRKGDKITLSSWQERHEKETGKPVRSITGDEMKKMLEAILQHYTSALVSIDIHEHMETLPTDEAREKEWEKILKASGIRPIGGFGAVGIDIRITGDRLASRYRNSYGDTGMDVLESWLIGQGAKWTDL